MARQAHVENFLWLKPALLDYCLQSVSGKSGWKENGTRPILVVSAENFREQRNIRKKNQTRFETPA